MFLAHGTGLAVVGGPLLRLSGFRRSGLLRRLLDVVGTKEPGPDRRHPLLKGMPPAGVAAEHCAQGSLNSFSPVPVGTSGTWKVW